MPDLPTPDPRLRGLDPNALLGVFGSERPPRPVVPGWEMENVIGHGGLGFVWRARRLSDSTLAAIKIPRLADIEHIERLELEAATLRALAHPNIVRLLESGPLDDGGMFLAMEYIDGPALSHALPATGFEPARAFALFHQIATAIVHAHERALIHRDLKPANILLAPDGTARVADFGLARPVHERVQHLSLTHTGLIAGTAEYLPPEAYRATHQPGVKGDIYALGIILHELLTGSPPRGAWHAVSQQRHVDIRVDEVLQKALAPDPAMRWSTVAEMSAALTEIQRTPPRYSGTPRITQTIRAADCAWTVLGLLVFIAAIGVEMRMSLVRVPWVIDLVGPHTKLTGGAQALWWLSLSLVPVAIWQIIRLFHFRAVPLREALPSPFGLCLGNSRTAGSLVLLAQIACLVLPALLLVDVFFESASRWIQPGDPPTRAGLVVTKWESDEMLSPLSWPEKGAHYWLKEYRGVPGKLLSRHKDRVDFYPGLMPWTLTAAAIIMVLAVVITDATAIIRWWPWQRKRALALLAATLVACAWVFWPEPKAPSLTEEQQALREQAQGTDNNELYVEMSGKVFRTLYSDPAPTREEIEKKVMPFYASEPNFRRVGIIPKSDILDILAGEAEAARKEGRTVEIVGNEWRPGLFDQDGYADMKSPYFHHRVTLLVFNERRAGLATGDWITIWHHAVIDPAQGTIRILQESYSSDGLSRSIPRDLSAAHAADWARDFVAAIGDPPPSHPPGPLEPLLTGRCYVTNDSWRNSRGEQRNFQRLEFIALLRATLLGDASKTRPALAGPPSPAERQPGARERITFPVRDANGLTHWQADLVFQDDRWRAVTVRF